MRARTPLLATLAVFGLTAAAWQLRRTLAARPRYIVERRVGRLEIRRYRPRVVAHTEVQRDFVAALREGHARLGRFARGENEGGVRIGPSEPFTVSPAASGDDTGGYVLAIDMPERHEPPRPSDARVLIDTRPARRVAALVFRGAISAARVRTLEQELLDAVREEGLTPVGETSFATYDAPSVLPLVRRSEIWVEV